MLKWKFNISQFNILVLFVIQIVIIFFVGIESYNIATSIFLIFIANLIIIYPLAGLVLLLIISIGVEGKLIEEFILFRFLGFNWYLTDLSFILIFISTGIRFISGAYKFKFNKISKSVFLFFLVIPIATFEGIKSGYSFANVFHDVRGFFYYLIFIPTIFIIKDVKELRKIIYIIIIIGAIKCGVDIIQSIFILPKSFDSTSRTLLNFARLTGYTEVTYPIITVLTFNLILLSDSIKNKIYLVVPLMLGLLALFLSYTRGSWLAVFLTIFASLVFMVREKKVKIKFSTLLFGLFGVLVSLLTLELLHIFSITQIIVRFTSISISSIDISNMGRLVEWATALEAFWKNPLLGAGFGFLYNYFAPGIGQLSTTFCHNSYLYVLSKMGLIGFFPFLLIIYNVLKVGYNKVKKSIDNRESQYVYVIISVFFMLCIKALTTWHLNTWTLSPFVGLIIGIAANFIEDTSTNE